MSSRDIGLGFAVVSCLLTRVRYKYNVGLFEGIGKVAGCRLALYISCSVTFAFLGKLRSMFLAIRVKPGDFPLIFLI